LLVIAKGKVNLLKQDFHREIFLHLPVKNDLAAPISRGEMKFFMVSLGEWPNGLPKLLCRAAFFDAASL